MTRIMAPPAQDCVPLCLSGCCAVTLVRSQIEASVEPGHCLPPF